MKSGALWAFFPVAVLGLSVTLHVVFLAVAASDPTLSVEENYYEKALHWDEERAQQARNRALGWELSVKVNDAALDEVQRVRWTGIDIELRDREGRPVTGAALHLETFHPARASRVLQTALTEIGAGTYRAALPMGRSGNWVFRVRATRREEVFTWRETRYLRVGAGATSQAGGSPAPGARPGAPEASPVRSAAAQHRSGTRSLARMRSGSSAIPRGAATGRGAPGRMASPGDARPVRRQT